MKPVAREVADLVRPVRGKQAILHVDHLLPVPTLVKSKRQPAFAAGTKRVLKLVAISPYILSLANRLHLKVRQATDPFQRFTHLIGLDLNLSLVRKLLPRSPGARLAGMNTLGLNPARADLDYPHRTRLGIVFFRLCDFGLDVVAGQCIINKNHKAVGTTDPPASVGKPFNFTLQHVSTFWPHHRRAYLTLGGGDYGACSR